MVMVRLTTKVRFSYSLLALLDLVIFIFKKRIHVNENRFLKRAKLRISSHVLTSLGRLQNIYLLNRSRRYLISLRCLRYLLCTLINCDLEAFLPGIWSDVNLNLFLSQFFLILKIQNILVHEYVCIHKKKPFKLSRVFTFRIRQNDDIEVDNDVIS